MDIDKALKLRSLGVDFDDMTNDMLMDSNTEYHDYFLVPTGERFYLRNMTFFTSGVLGALELRIDGSLIFNTVVTVPRQFEIFPFDINEWAKNDVDVYIKNPEPVQHVANYTMEIVRMPDSARQEAVEVLIG